jgi:TonB family protein
MSRSSHAETRIRASVLLLIFAIQAYLIGQSASSTNQQEGGPALAELVGLTYPPIARAARVSGRVEVDVLIGAAGKAESAQVISGPPMLQPASLQAARQSQYTCRGCSNAVHYRITFVYKVVPTEPPKDCDGPLPAAPPPEWDATRNEATAFAMEIWTCDPVAETTRTFRRVRSAKCLYLWKCGLRPTSN